MRVGPTRDPEVVRRTAGRLAQRYAVVGQVRSTWAVLAYKVLSGPVRLQQAAEERRQVLSALGFSAEVRKQRGGEYVLDFGIFRDAAAAGRVARAVRTRGSVAVVVPVQVRQYTLTVGPVPERVALAMARTLREAGVDVFLTRRP